MPRHLPILLILASTATATSCGETTESTPCDTYRAALVAYADRCEPLALPPGGDPASIECASDGAHADAGTDLAHCTALLERHTDPCISLLWRFDPGSTEVQRDEHADLRAELYACAREPISDIATLPFEDDCAAWRDAVGRYRACDPAVVPVVATETRCVDDDELPEGRTVRGCAQTLWERTDRSCSVPLGEQRAQCLDEIIAD